MIQVAGRPLMVAFALAVVVGACATPETTPGGGGGGGATGSGGSTSSGTGGAAPTTGAGGAIDSGVSTGNGGAGPSGTGGTTSGAGGATVTGAGGAASGAGGSTGTGGVTGTGGTTTTGAGGAGGRPPGTGGAGGTTTGAGGTTTGAGGAGGTTGAGGAGGTVTTRPTEIWVAPNGSDANPGTEALPMLTICDTVAKVGACYKICPSSYSCPAAGATIWLKAGTHRITRKVDIGATRPGASATGRMKLWAAPGARPVLDATGAEGAIAVHLKGSYWHVRGIEIRNAPSNCVKVEGGFNIVEDTIVHNCGNTGITISAYAGEDMSAGPGTNNLILNCDSYANVGPNNNGEDADGFGAKEQSGAGNIFRGCRAWNNADDGFDFYGWGSPITVEDSWAFESNQMGASGGDGNGFKLGLGPGRHVLRNCIAAENTKRGYTCNGASGQSTCTNCRGCNNDEGLNDTGSRAVLGSVTTLSPCVNLTRAKAARGANGALPPL